MSIRNRVAGAVLPLALITTLGATAFAQQGNATGKAAPEAQEQRMRKGGRHHRGAPVMRMMRHLNLTDVQQEQARVIVERFKTTIEPQRQALKELRKQRVEGTVSDDIREKAKAQRLLIGEALKRTQGELLTILTPEQRTQYDELEQQMKARREERRARRGGCGMGEHSAPPGQ